MRRGKPGVQDKQSVRARSKATGIPFDVRFGTWDDKLFKN
jgi:hypothetical protein